MDNPLRNLKNVAARIGNGLGKAAEVFDSADPLIVFPYRGYASEQRIFLKGRVLEDENIFKGKTDSEIRNIINNFKRFETDEIPEANVRITYGGQSFECTTDTEGYFTLDESWNAPPKSVNDVWLPVKAELLFPVRKDESKITARGEVLLPSGNAEYGVISDIDDTILQTHVSSLFRLKMLYTTFVKNAHQRMPMEGMAELLRAFANGSDGQKENPIFYVSHSPWNIYDLLETFLGVQDFPKGPMLLRDFGLFNPAGEYRHHKVTSISHILDTYPHLPFILLGDSAEKDADFYIDIAAKFPERIKAIYIRQTRDTKNARRIKKLVEEHAHINTVLVQSSEEIKTHASELGLLVNQTFTQI